MNPAMQNPFEFLFKKLESLESKIDSLTVQKEAVQWVNPKQASEHLKTSVQTVRRLANIGELEYSRIGNKMRFKKSDLDEYLAKN